MLNKTALAAIAALSFLFTTSVAPNLAVAAQKDGKQASAKKKSSKKVVNKKVVNKKVVKKTVVHRGGSVSGSTVAFVTLGTPVVYKAYGAGWCRALHRGRHYAPGAGWHSGKHVGRVRC
jgi:hypothetical protein